MKLMYIVFYSLGEVSMLTGLVSGTLIDGSGTDGAILGTRLLLDGAAATFVKIGSVTVIAGWFVEFLCLSSGKC